MRASNKYATKWQRLPTSNNSDDSWLYSSASWIFPNSAQTSTSNPMLSYNSSDEEVERSSLKQSLLPRKTSRVYCSSKFLAIFMSIFTVIISVALLLLLPCPTGAFINAVFKFKADNPPIPSNPDQELIFHDRTFKIALLGDSLINKPFKSFQLEDKIKAYLPGYNFEMINCGINGAQIGTIRNDIIPQCVTPFAPDAILIFWDSDVSDVSESDMSADEVFALRDKYETNLFGALDTLMQTGAYVALGGPGVLGEGGMLFAPDEGRFRDKEPMLEAYSTINKQAATRVGIPYIDVRRAFLDYIPSYQLCYSRCVTLDGEHENDRGTVILARLFATSLSNWLAVLKP